MPRHRRASQGSLRRSARPRCGYIKAYQRKVHTLPKHLDEKVAALHLEQIGARLTKLTRKQAAYIGVPPGGPYKSEHYRY